MGDQRVFEGAAESVRSCYDFEREGRGGCGGGGRDGGFGHLWRWGRQDSELGVDTDWIVSLIGRGSLNIKLIIEDKGRH